MRKTRRKPGVSWFRSGLVYSQQRGDVNHLCFRAGRCARVEAGFELVSPGGCGTHGHALIPSNGAMLSTLAQPKPLSCLRSSRAEPRWLERTVASCVLWAGAASQLPKQQ